MILSRRMFGQIAASGLTTAAHALAAKKVPVAVQLYSVRQIAQKDLAGVLAQVKKLGYQGVEFAGYYGHSAADVKKMLDANGLKVAGTHTGLDLLQGDKFQETVDYMKVIGNKTIIVPSLPQKYRSDLNAWKETAKLFNELSDKLKPHGMEIGFHNHNLEVQPMEGQMPLEVFYNATKPAVRVQLDVGHAQRGGADPVAFLKKFKDRVVSIHIKEYKKGEDETVLGEGEIQWKQVFDTLESGKGIKWYIIEEEGKSCKEFECIERSVNILRTKFGKKA